MSFLLAGSLLPQLPTVAVACALLREHLDSYAVPRIAASRGSLTLGTIFRSWPKRGAAVRCIPRLIDVNLVLVEMLDVCWEVKLGRRPSDGMVRHLPRGVSFASQTAKLDVRE